MKRRDAAIAYLGNDEGTAISTSESPSPSLPFSPLALNPRIIRIALASLALCLPAVFISVGCAEEQEAQKVLCSPTLTGETCVRVPNSTECSMELQLFGPAKIRCIDKHGNVSYPDTFVETDDGE